MAYTIDAAVLALLDALVADGMFVTLWYPPKRTNSDLIKSADQRQQLDVRSIHSALADSSTKFDIPKLWYSGGQTEGPVIKTWEIGQGQVELRSHQREFLVILPKDATGSWMHIQHADMDLLRTFSQDIFSVAIP